MELVNQTGVPADASLTVSVDTPGLRRGYVRAKATFVAPPGSQPRLDIDGALPLWDEDVPTPLGTLPHDLPLPALAEDLRCDVLLLGAAYSPRRNHQRVSMTIAHRRWNLDVFGESVRHEDQASEPQPFERVPLNWEHTYGGTCPVWLDRASVIDIGHRGNPVGLGFDPRGSAAGLASHLGAEDGFPRLEALSPRLPRVVAAGQTPLTANEPACWAPAPTHVPWIHELHFERWRREHPDDEDMDVEWLTALRAHPDRVLPAAPVGHQVRLDGVRPDGPMEFGLPVLRVAADYTIQDRSGTLDLHARRIVFLPEERRFYMTFFAFFRVPDLEEGDERSMRLRVA